MATKYTVGDTNPPSPLILHLKTSDGQPYDVSNYDTVTVLGDDDLPPGTTTVVDAVNGIVQRTFDTPFLAAGLLLVRVKLETALTEDWATGIELPVYDPTVPTSLPLIMDTDEVEGITGVLVSENDIAQAQGLVSLIVDRDLTDATLVAGLSTHDLYRVKQAIAWQSTAYATGAGSVPAFQVPAGTTGFSIPDLSMSFGSPTTAASALLVPTAALALQRLTWFGARTLYATPFTGGYPQPSTWRLISTGGQL